MPTLRINIENENDTHFLTITTIEWIDIFTKLEYFEVIIDSLKYCQNNKGLLIFEYVIMTNHIHLMCRAKEEFKLSQIISDFKKHTTRELLKLLKKDNRRYIISLLENSYRKKDDYENQIWQRENYPEIMTTEVFYNQKMNYIHNNPIKKGFIGKAEDWMYSSARNRILGDNATIKLDS